MNKTRESNYDLLRIVSAIAIIAIHVSVTYLSAGTDNSIFGDYYLGNENIVCLYNILSRFAVPCFIMLSGAFILMDDKNAEYRYFYRKILIKIGIPTLIFSVLYFLYSMLFKMLEIGVKGKQIKELLIPIKQMIKGSPYYHLWYLYMFIGIYLLVPIVIRFKADIGEYKFEKISYAFLVVASLSDWTSTHKFMWDIGSSFCYLGYFMIGYVLRKKFSNRKNNKVALVLLLSGIVIELAVAYLCICHEDMISMISWLAMPLCPMIVISSVLIFVAFSRMKIDMDFGKLSSYTFYIYLFHAGIWNFGPWFIKKLGVLGDSKIVLPVNIGIVFFLSLFFAIIYERIQLLLYDKLRRLQRI